MHEQAVPHLNFLRSGIMFPVFVVGALQKPNWMFMECNGCVVCVLLRMLHGAVVPCIRPEWKVAWCKSAK